MSIVDFFRQDMDKAAEGHLSAQIYYINPNEEKSVGNLTAAEFTALRRKEPNFAPEKETYAFLAPATYDAVWGCALALNCTITAMKERGTVLHIIKLNLFPVPVRLHSGSGKLKVRRYFTIF